MTDQFSVGDQMTLVRTFDAPRQLVFDCFTRPEHMARWWGPRQFTAPVCELDPRPGGQILVHMAGPEPYGTNPMAGEFIEVSPPDRLVFSSQAYQGEDGEWRIDNLNELDFTEQDGKTVLTLVVTVRKVSAETLQALGGMREGWSQSFDKLAELLPELV